MQIWGMRENAKTMCKECSTLYSGDTCPMCRRFAGNAAIQVLEMPVNFEDCTKPQLEHLLINGTYAQRIISARYLKIIAAQK